LLKRVKRRYLLLEIEADRIFDSNEFMDAVWDAVKRLYGEYGASRTGLVLIDYDQEGKRAVIRVALTALDIMRAALASVTKIGIAHASIHVLKVSGTLHALTRKES
jgi:RNase P/RNase MRP subunit POP5